MKIWEYKILFNFKDGKICGKNLLIQMSTSWMLQSNYHSRFKKDFICFDIKNGKSFIKFSETLLDDG